MSKFIRLVLGPIHFETRFLPFLKDNENTLKNYLFIVDNYELYEPYKNLVDIVDIDKIRNNHPWSKEKEFIYSEKNKEAFLKNYHFECSNNLATINIVRLIFPYLYENNILKFSITTNNFFITNNQKKIDDYFSFLNKGEFQCLKLTSEDPLFWPQSEKIKDELSKEFSDLMIPNKYCYFDGYAIDFSFYDKEDLLLFYKIWEKITFIFIEDKHLYNTLYSYNHSTICPDALLGYIISIFIHNKSYLYKNAFSSNNSILSIGKRVSMPHDTWHCSPGRLTLFSGTNFDINENVKEIGDFVKLNKEKLINFYSQYSHSFDINYLENNISFKYKH